MFIGRTDWCSSWNSNTLATWCEELTHLKRPRCWERLRAGGEEDSRGWDGWMASPTQWLWVWVNSRSWWWTGRPGVLRFVGLQRVRHDWATELSVYYYSVGLSYGPADLWELCSQRILVRNVTFRGLCGLWKGIGDSGRSWSDSSGTSGISPGVFLVSGTFCLLGCNPTLTLHWLN